MVDSRPHELAHRAFRLERPQEALEALSVLRQRLAILERIHVRNAREAGMTWGQIGDLLGVSKQGLHKKHAEAVRNIPAPQLSRKEAAQVVVTGEARRAVRYAQEEARARGHFPVGTGHLLLGLLRHAEASPARALVACGVTLGGLREQVDRFVAAMATPKRRLDQLPVSRAARRALEQSLHEAVRLGDGHLGVEHVLLGVLREDRGAAAQALTALGTSAQAVEAELMAALEQERARAGTSDAVPNVAA